MESKSNQVVELKNISRVNMDSYFVLPTLGYTRNEQMYMHINMLDSVVSKLLGLYLRHDYTEIQVNFNDIGFTGIRSILFELLKTALKFRGVDCEILMTSTLQLLPVKDVLRVEFLPVGALELNFGVEYNKHSNDPTAGVFGPVKHFILSETSDVYDLHVMFLLPENWQHDDDFTEMLESLAIENETTNKPQRIPLILSLEIQSKELKFLPQSKSSNVKLSTAIDIQFDPDLESYTFSYSAPLSYEYYAKNKLISSGKYNYPNSTYTLHNLSKAELTREIKVLNKSKHNPIQITYDADFSVLFFSKKEL